MGKSSIANVQYWHTSIAVLSRKYSSNDGEVLQFGSIQTEFSLCWKYFFALLKIFFQALENFWKQRAIWIGTKVDCPQGLCQRLHELSNLNLIAPCQAKNKNRLLSKKRAPTLHRHRVSVENRLIHCKLQSTTDTLENSHEYFILLRFIYGHSWSHCFSLGLSAKLPLSAL